MSKKVYAMRFLFILFIATPIVEMWVLITVGSHIGPVSAVLLVLLTALVGLSLLKQQGFATLWRGSQKLHEGELPAQEIAETMVLAISGVLLLVPGFVTDSLGFIGLIPILRQLFVSRILKNIRVVRSHRKYSPSNQKSDEFSPGETIEGDSWMVNKSDD
jgi:UPF0716 protein FxsA